MGENVCKFAPTRTTETEINIINFVYEREANFKQSMGCTAAYSVNLVTGGTGVLHTPYGDRHLCEGTLFLTFAAKPYYIENTGDLTYMYVSFVGQRISALYDRLRLHDSEPVRESFGFLRPLWEEALASANGENIDLVCEGLLLYTFSFLSGKSDEKSGTYKPEGILRLKEYVDAHYTDAELSLKTVSDRFGYSEKYVSKMFSKTVRMNFSAYLNQKRLDRAKTLIESGMISVREIAAECGYRDPMYFSRLYKNASGKSPKTYAMEIRRENQG